MSEPTARELMDKHEWFGKDGLAKRVDAVLALAGKRHANEGYDAALRDVLRLLNGEAK
jgi:hypothetical protein